MLESKVPQGLLRVRQGLRRYDVSSTYAPTTATNRTYTHTVVQALHVLTIAVNGYRAGGATRIWQGMQHGSTRAHDDMNSLRHRCIGRKGKGGSSVARSPKPKQ